MVEESLVLLQPPLLSSSEERLGCFLKALLSLLPHLSFLHVLLLSPKFLLGGYCMHWGWLSRSYSIGATDCVSGFPPFGNLSTVVWLDLATCWRRTSERNLSVGSLHALVLVSRGFTKSWVGQVALRSPTNRHALDLLFHWTTNTNRHEFLYWVYGALSLICTQLTTTEVGPGLETFFTSFAISCSSFSSLAAPARWNPKWFIQSDHPLALSPPVAAMERSKVICIAPLRLVSWVSCEVPARVQQVLHQLMTLFGEVAPVSSNEVLEIGRQQLGVTASGELSWVEVVLWNSMYWQLTSQWTAPAPETIHSISQTAVVCNWNWDCSLWKWGTKGITCSPLATYPAWKRTRPGYFERCCAGLVWRTYWISYQWCVWCWQNSLCCSPSGWSIGLWPEPSTDGPHERKYRSPCSCWASCVGDGYADVWSWACLGWTCPLLSSWSWACSLSSRWVLHRYA